MYAVKAVTCMPPGVGGLAVDLDREVLNGLLQKQYPNIVNIRDIWSEITVNEKLYIQMDWVATSLRDLLALGWRFEGSHWFDVVWAIAHGVSQAHQYGVVHGDLKPANSSTLLKPLTEM